MNKTFPEPPSFDERAGEQNHAPQIVVEAPSNLTHLRQQPADYTPQIVRGYSIDNFNSMTQLATVLENFIAEKKLYADISGKKYVMVEGWQFAGAMLGLTAYADKDVENISTKDERAFRGYASVYRVSDNKKLSSASMTCSNKEKKKREFDDYALESMAQTRAISKAYRLYMSWVMKAAGYEVTPFEEVDGIPVEHTVLASEEHYQKLDLLMESKFYQTDDLTPADINKIKQRTLTDKEAKTLIKELSDKQDKRNF